MAHKISSEEVNQFQVFFSKVLELPEELLDDSHSQWDGLAILVQSLRCRVPTEWVSKGIRLKMKLEYELKVFSITKDHLILKFQVERDYSLV